jgi:hypothetical protein
VTDFERLLQALSAGGVEYILVGGLAANAHGAIRTTRDVDVVYARSRANLERLEQTLIPLRPCLIVPPGQSWRAHNCCSNVTRCARATRFSWRVVSSFRNTARTM